MPFKLPSFRSKSGAKEATEMTLTAEEWEAALESEDADVVAAVIPNVSQAVLAGGVGSAGGDPPVRWAVIRQLDDVVRVLLDSGVVDPAAENRDEQTALHAAAALEKHTLLDMLLEDPRVNINADDKFGDTALVIAAIKNRVPNTIALLQRPELDIGATSLYSGCALDCAKRYNHTAIDNLIRSESSHRARVTRVSRLFAIRQRVDSLPLPPHDAVEVGAPDRTLRLLAMQTHTEPEVLLSELGPYGCFVFSPKCPDELVPDILLMAGAGTECIFW